MRKNLEKGDTPNSEIKEMDEHFTAMTGLEMDSNRGFKFVLTEDGNYDIEKTPLHGYDSVYQYTSVWDDLLETRKTVMNFMSPKNLKAEFDEKDIAGLLRTFEKILALTGNLSNVRYLLQSLFLISAEPDSKKIPGK